MRVNCSDSLLDSFCLTESADPSASVGVAPVFLGNIVGGGLFVGIYYWWMYLCGSATVTVDGLVHGEGDTRIAETMVKRVGERYMSPGLSGVVV